MQNDSINADMYFKVERKSRQEKGITVVSLLVNAPTEAASTDSLRYLKMEQAKTYLNELIPAIDAYNLEGVIKDQNESLIKAESKLKSLVNDGKDLEDKRTSIDKKIADNKAEQQNQVNEIEAQKAKLAGTVAQRKG
jgi:predicted nucleotidyltransferase